MKKLLTLLALSLVISTCLLAQQAPKVKFEKVSDEELKMTTYTPDTSAVAVILYDDGTSEVKFDVSKERFMLSFDRFIRIKILKQAGTSWGNFSFPLYSSNENREAMTAVKGTTYNLENGKVVKTDMKKESVFQERENKYTEMVRLSLPSVKVGSVIDLKYTITSPLLWNLREWKFQYTIPVKWSQYEVIYPEYFLYNRASTGYHTLNQPNHERRNVTINYTAKYQTEGSAMQGGGLRRQENQSFTYMADVYQYSGAQVPAIKEEPYLTTLDNYTSKIKFELARTDLVKVGGSLKNYTTTWNDIANLLLEDEDFGSQIKSANYTNEVLSTLLNGKTDEKQKMLALYTFVQKNIKWNGNNSYSPSSTLKKVFNEKIGNSAEVNLLLLAMLREAGIEAYPVVLSTRANGLMSFVHPSISDCNYAIVKAIINKTPILLDATEANMEAGMLPFRCLNGTGRIISKGNAEEVPLVNPISNTSTFIAMELKEGKFTGTVLSRGKGLNAFDFREAVKTAGGQKEYFENLKNESTNIQYMDYSYSNLDSLHLPVVKKYNIVLQNETDSESEADILYFNPFFKIPF